MDRVVLQSKRLNFYSQERKRRRRSCFLWDVSYQPQEKRERWWVICVQSKFCFRLFERAKGKARKQHEHHNLSFCLVMTCFLLNSMSLCFCRNSSNESNFL